MRGGPVTHGETVGRGSSPEYTAWKAMKERCYYLRHASYANYGGRGIRVCHSWRVSFAAFLADVGRRPSPAYSLDRIDPDGHYRPGNIRWATRAEQRRNSRAVHPVTLDGVTLLITDWATVSGVPEESIATRLRNGWGTAAAIFTKIGTTPRKTMCPRGHVYDVSNTRVNRRGARVCRACDRARRL